MWPPIQNTKIFLVKAFQLEPLVNDHLSWGTASIIWGLWFNDFPPFLTSCKRPRDDLSDLLCSLCVLCYFELYTKNFRINLEPYML